MNNLIIGLLLLYLIYTILCNSVESFDLYQSYKYPYCESCTTDNNEIKCNNCIMYLAQHGIKQPTNTYYKKVFGSKKKLLKECQSDSKCKIVDYDSHNNVGYLSTKQLNENCLFKQSSDKYIHFTKLSTKMQNINSNLNKLREKRLETDTTSETDVDTAPTQPSTNIANTTSSDKILNCPAIPKCPTIPKWPEMPKCPEIPKCPEMPKCPEIPRPRGISRIVKRKRCRKKQ